MDSVRYSNVNWFDVFDRASRERNIDLQLNAIPLLAVIEQEHILERGFPHYFYLTFFDYCSVHHVGVVSEKTVKDFLKA